MVDSDQSGLDQVLKEVEEEILRFVLTIERKMDAREWGDIRLILRALARVVKESDMERRVWQECEQGKVLFLKLSALTGKSGVARDARKWVSALGREEWLLGLEDMEVEEVFGKVDLGRELQASLIEKVVGIPQTMAAGDWNGLRVLVQELSGITKAVALAWLDDTVKGKMEILSLCFVMQESLAQHARELIAHWDWEDLFEKEKTNVVMLPNGCPVFPTIEDEAVDGDEQLGQANLHETELWRHLES